MHGFVVMTVVFILLFIIYLFIMFIYLSVNIFHDAQRQPDQQMSRNTVWIQMYEFLILSDLV